MKKPFFMGKNISPRQLLMEGNNDCKQVPKNPASHRNGKVSLSYFSAKRPTLVSNGKTLVQISPLYRCCQSNVRPCCREVTCAIAYRQGLLYACHRAETEPSL